MKIKWVRNFEFSYDHIVKMRQEGGWPDPTLMSTGNEFRGKNKNEIYTVKKIGVREAQTLDLRITQKLWDLQPQDNITYINI